MGTKEVLQETPMMDSHGTGWYIYLLIYHGNQLNVGKYTLDGSYRNLHASSAEIGSRQIF